VITFLCAAVCQGCRAPVNLWRHNGQVVIRDRSMVESPVHLCRDPEQREHIEIGFLELMAFECWRCGSRDVAPTSWGRIVDFPCSDPTVEGWAEAWVGPLEEHVCSDGDHAPAAKKQPSFRTVG
jgi:hypothetical protein